MRRLFLFLFVLAMLPGLLINHRRHHQDVFRTVCELAWDHFYKRDRTLQDWTGRCLRRAEAAGFFGSTAELLGEIQDQLNGMNASHFQIYDPYEDKRLWKGESLDTGLRARFVEDHLIVNRVLRDTPAFEAGVRAGDEILSIEGAEQLTPWGAQHRSGRFTFERGGEKRVVGLVARLVVVETLPSLSHLRGGAAILEISSFRSEFFGHDFWTKFTRSFTAPQAGIHHLIIDLRENSGGNFVAMLRALSTFLCRPTLIGRIVQPRRAGRDKSAFDDELEDEKQLEALDSYHSMGLRTFSGYGCYRGRVTVLVDSQTASVSEIFAEAMAHRPHTRVWGQPTAGDVLLAVWYDLAPLGPGYSVSVPEAIYLTRAGEALENGGVTPEKDLYYDLKTSRGGLDSWVEQSLRP